MDTKYKKTIILQKYIRKIMPNKKPGLHIPHDTGHSSFICGHNLHLFVSAILHVEISLSWHLQISHVWMHVVFADGNCKQSDFPNPLHNSWSRSSQTADKLIYIYQQRQQNNITQNFSYSIDVQIYTLATFEVVFALAREGNPFKAIFAFARNTMSTNTVKEGCRIIDCKNKSMTKINKSNWTAQSKF